MEERAGVRSSVMRTAGYTLQTGKAL